MRVSDYFKLGRTQPTLDFVDVDIERDTKLFLSPSALASLPSDWGAECAHLIQDFFKTVLDHIKAGKHGEAERLLRALKEPNETHLGLSLAKSKGRALGHDSAHDVWEALTNSKAAKSGLIVDLEDTVLFVEGIGPDIISDITTNIIRGPLIEYTQRVAKTYGIPLSVNVAAGPTWNSATKAWNSVFADLPVTPEGRLLLIPKAIVRQHPAYKLDEYYRHYLIPHLQDFELSSNSALVQIIKRKGKPSEKKVYKKDVYEKYGSKKDDAVRETLNHPPALDEYKKAKGEPTPAMPHSELSDAGNTPPPKWTELLNNALSIAGGAAGATKYEKAIEALLSALFYPDLAFPRPQEEIHNGRKRIDISYTNMATMGFFSWLSKHHPSANIFVECKNYTREIANPELDQLSGRFSPSRGQVGILVCRSFDDKARFLERCRDTAKDSRGFIIALDDEDLREIVEARITSPVYQDWEILFERFRMLTN